MITISTRDYSINQLKQLSRALYAVKCNILESDECDAEVRHFWALPKLWQNNGGKIL